MSKHFDSDDVKPGSVLLLNRGDEGGFWEVAWDPNEAHLSLCELRPCFSIISCGGAAVPYE